MQETNINVNVNTKEADLQNQISAKREQLSGLYAHLGKKYYSYHRHDAEQEFQTDVETINAGENELARLENQLKKLQEGLICPGCGAELNRDDRFCPACGRKVSQNISVDNSSICPRCGNAVSAGQRFCVKCGYSLFEDLEENIVKAAFESQQNIADNAAETAGSTAPAVCPSCGEPVDEDMNFCIACGYRLHP